MAQRRTKSYTGGQYRGGRTAGRKNLEKIDGGFRNQFGIEFTEAEKKALESAVNTANRKRARMLKAEANLPRMVDGKETGDTVKSLQLMGKESDFILAPKSKSLQRFKSREEFENYLDNLREVNDRGYIDKRTEAYRENYFTALDRAFGDEAEDIKEKLRSMTPKEYREFVASNDDTLEIGYIYLPSKRTEKLNEIRSTLGLEAEEIPEDDEILDLRRAAKRKSSSRRKTRRK